jgi:hypothetical protein
LVDSGKASCASRTRVTRKSVLIGTVAFGVIAGLYVPTVFAQGKTVKVGALHTLASAKAISEAVSALPPS